MPDTTFIIGAGASADFGLPLGSSLYDRSLNQLKTFIMEWEKGRELSGVWHYNNAKLYFGKVEPYNSLLSLFGDGHKIELDSIYDLAQLMEIAPAYSIDTLALENPEYLEICKVVTAHEIIEALKSSIEEKPNGAGCDWQFMHRKIRKIKHGNSILEDNWIHLCVSMIRNSLRKTEDRYFNFISFNYDCLLENVMRRIWEIPSQKLGEFDDIFSFSYPHGKIHWQADKRLTSQFGIRESQIEFAHNKRNRDSFSQAVKFIKRSDIVVSLGFHFAPENTQSLGLSDHSDGFDLIYQNYSGSEGLDRRVANLGLKSTASFNGAISPAILDGRLGELPS